MRMRKEKKKSEWTDEKVAEMLDKVLEENTGVMTISSGREINDNESMHIDADNILVELLEREGYTKTAEKYKEIRKYFRYCG